MQEKNKEKKVLPGRKEETRKKKSTMSDIQVSRFIKLVFVSHIPQTVHLLFVAPVTITCDFY